MLQHRPAEVLLRTIDRLVLALLALAAVTTGCAAKPINKPIDVGPIASGAGSLEATRRQLEGTWTLASFAVVAPDGRQTARKASGTLTYDAFGGMSIRGVFEEGTPQTSVVLDYNGRIVIDVVRKEFRSADLTTDRTPDVDAVAPVSPDKVRKYELTDRTFKVTYLDAQAKPTAVASWTRADR
jgi:hypothetical protein